MAIKDSLAAHPQKREQTQNTNLNFVLINFKEIMMFIYGINGSLFPAFINCS